MAGAATVDAAAMPAAPTPAVLMNFLRFMFSISSLRDTHMAPSARQDWHAKWALERRRKPKETPPKRGFTAIPQLFARLTQSLLTADWRDMKLSNVFSHTRN